MKKSKLYLFFVRLAKNTLFDVPQNFSNCGTSNLARAGNQARAPSVSRSRGVGAAGAGPLCLGTWASILRDHRSLPPVKAWQEEVVARGTRKAGEGDRLGKNPLTLPGPGQICQSSLGKDRSG